MFLQKAILTYIYWYVCSLCVSVLSTSAGTDAISLSDSKCWTQIYLRKTSIWLDVIEVTPLLDPLLSPYVCLEMGLKLHSLAMPWIVLRSWCNPKHFFMAKLSCPVCIHKRKTGLEELTAQLQPGNYIGCSVSYSSKICSVFPWSLISFLWHGYGQGIMGFWHVIRSGFLSGVCLVCFFKFCIFSPPGYL